MPLMPTPPMPTKWICWYFLKHVASCASGLACWEMFSRTPAENIVIRSAEPPKDMNGSGRPFVGRAPVTTPRFTRVCVASMTVSPSAR